MGRFWQIQRVFDGYILALWDIDGNVSFTKILYHWELLVLSDSEKTNLFIRKSVIHNRAWTIKDFDKFEEFWGN